MVKCQGDGDTDKECGKTADYGIIGTSPKYCTKHKNIFVANNKDAIIVNYSKAQCEVKECPKEARYGPKLTKEELAKLSNKSKLKICPDHKNLFPTYILLDGPLCTSPECFNKAVTSKKYCNPCGKVLIEGYIVPVKYPCLDEQCYSKLQKTKATYNLYGIKIPIRCAYHASPEMVDVVSEMCIECEKLC